MTKEERQHWIDRWNSLKPSPKRDMIIKMWGGKPNTNVLDRKAYSDNETRSIAIEFSKWMKENDTPENSSLFGFP